MGKLRLAQDVAAIDTLFTLKQPNSGLIAMYLFIRITAMCTRIQIRYFACRIAPLLCWRVNPPNRTLWDHDYASHSMPGGQHGMKGQHAHLDRIQFNELETQPTTPTAPLSDSNSHFSLIAVPSTTPPDYRSCALASLHSDRPAPLSHVVYCIIPYRAM